MREGDADYIHRARSKARAARTSDSNDRVGDKRSESNGSTDPDARPAWDRPIPFANAMHLPLFPADCLPSWLKGWVLAEAEATQTPIDLAGLCTLGVAGAALAKKFRVLVRQGFAEPVNLFTVVALEVGERKSIVFRDVLEPVKAYEAEELARTAPLIAELAGEHRALEARVKASERRAAKNNPDEDCMEVVKQRARELAAHTVPEVPRMFVDDATIESLPKMMASQGGRILQASSEGGPFEVMKGRYSDGKANFDVYLKGHAGDQLRVDRVGRAPDLLDDPALSVVLTVQPDVIRGLAEQVTLRNRGVLARFLYAIPVSLVGRRKIGPLPVPETVAKAFREGMLMLWQLKGTVDEAGKPVPHWIRFSGSSDSMMRKFEAWIEPLLAEGQELSFLAGWANKLVGAIARLAGILHVAEAIAGDGSWTGSIAPETLERAIRLAKYLIPHAKAAFGMMGADERLGDARRVVNWLTKSDSVKSVNCVNGDTILVVSTRDIHAGIFGGSTRTVDEVEGVLSLLEKYGYIRPFEEQPQHGRGRKPSPRWEVNPQVRETQECHPHSHNSQNSQTGDHWEARAR